MRSSVSEKGRCLWCGATRHLIDGFCHYCRVEGYHNIYAVTGRVPHAHRTRNGQPDARRGDDVSDRSAGARK